MDASAALVPQITGDPARVIQRFPVAPERDL